MWSSGYGALHNDAETVMPFFDHGDGNPEYDSVATPFESDFSDDISNLGI